MTDPSQLVNSMSSLISFDSVKGDDPKIDWINPLKLQFAAKLYYTKNLSSSETGAIESPLLVTLERSDINSKFAFSSAINYFEKNVVLSRKKVNDVPSKEKADAIKAATPAPTKPIAGAWKEGDKVKVEENGKWHPSTVLFVRKGEWFIQFDDYDAKFNEWVVATRIKNR